MQDPIEKVHDAIKQVNAERRDMFAAFALQGLLANGEYTDHNASVRQAVRLADILIALLDTPPKNPS